MAATLINGRAYDHTQIILNILGVPIVSVSSVTYTEEQEKANNFGASNRPVSRGHSSIDASASLEISMNDVEAIRDAAPGGSLLLIPAFDIVVTFANPENIVQTHVLKACEFTNDGVDSSQGDTDISRTFDLVVAEIKYR